MADLERKRAQTAARVRRYRQRQAERSAERAEVAERTAHAVAAQLETQHPGAAGVLADLDPDLAGAAVRALNSRRIDRAAARGQD